MAKGRSGVGAPPGGQRHRPPRVGAVLFVLSTIFFGVNFAQEWLDGHQVQQQAARLTQEIKQTEARSRDLLRAQAYYSSKSYITRYAHEIGMARPGDTLLVIQQDQPQVRIVHKSVPAPAPDNIFARLLHTIFQ